MSLKLFCPEGEYKGQSEISLQILSRAAECMDKERELAAEEVRAGGEKVIRRRYGRKTTSDGLDYVIESLTGPNHVNPTTAVDKKQVDTITWANPNGWGRTNKMALKSIGVVEGEATVMKLGQAGSEFLKLAPKQALLLEPILILAYGFETDYWGNNRETLKGAIYHVALSWLTWNQYPGNIHLGEKVCTERVWDASSEKLIAQVTNANVARSQLAHALEYRARVNPYLGGLGGL
ncbi:MAG: hypothetical protein ABII21_04535 [bacterium]